MQFVLTVPDIIWSMVPEADRAYIQAHLQAYVMQVCDVAMRIPLAEEYAKQRGG